MDSVAFQRRAALDELGSGPFDVLVIGGGITGAGIALDAASRGLSVALVERDDFASGTSSKSSKLIHGGLRYLQQREFRMVYQGLVERQRALANAAHLVRVLPFLIPILSRDGLINPKIARALGTAMWIYDLSGGARIGKLHKRLTPQEALAHMPTMPRDNLAAAYLYYDAQADDARLTLTIARTAATYGAVIANRARVVSLIKDAPGRVRGATIEADGSRIDVAARVVVNATGVWSDAVRALDEGANPRSIRPAKGIHITVPWDKVRNDIAVIVPVPKDRRSIFVVPWGRFTYIGTTDTDYSGPLDDPAVTSDDVSYLLDAVNLAVTEPITRADVLATWAGLRPLVAGGSVGEKTADLSRHHQVQPGESGMITITGGKLTTYRRMAADTVDAVMSQLGRRGSSRTKRLALIGSTGTAPPDEHLARRYGTLSADVAGLARDDPTLDEELVPGLPYRKAEAIYAVREEMATTLDDVLSRRTRARLLNRDATAAAAGDVAQLIGAELGWSDAKIAEEASAYRADAVAERESAQLPETALDATLGT